MLKQYFITDRENKFFSVLTDNVMRIKFYDKIDRGYSVTYCFSLYGDNDWMITFYPNEPNFKYICEWVDNFIEENGILMFKKTKYYCDSDEYIDSMNDFINRCFK